jgi:hypothetical protein
MKLVPSLALTCAVLLTPTIASAQYPPIQSPQDQACRSEAASRVFSDGNPRQLSMYERGRQYWTECMRRKGRRI